MFLGDPWVNFVDLFQNNCNGSRVIFRMILNILMAQKV